MKPDLLQISDLSREALTRILDLSEEANPPRVLEGQGVALVFQKPSARTRNSMEMAVVQLGGHPVTIRDEDVGLGTRETPEDAARTLACYHACIAARVFEHELLESMAEAVDAPVINMLSQDSHPLQALADILTMRQAIGDLKGAKIAYVGDVNNVSRSLAEAAAMLDMRMTVAAPESVHMAAGELDRLNALGGEISQTADAEAAVKDAQFVYTDVWTSMGDSDPEGARAAMFAPYQVNADLMGLAPDASFLHCLPAYRGAEVTSDVIDGPASLVWKQAENRMHTARGALSWIFLGAL